jgi:hypothetical protein
MKRVQTLFVVVVLLLLLLLFGDWRKKGGGSFKVCSGEREAKIIK